MTSRPDYYPLVALTPLANFAIPPSGVILQGWGIGAVFPSRDANWLFRQHGDWLKYADQQALHSSECLDPSVVQRVTSTSIALPTGAGLSVSPTGSGVYYADGLRVDLTDAATVYTGFLALTIPPSTTFYLHARPQPDTGGPVALSSVGELMVSTNASEAGYVQIGEGMSDATDITSYSDSSVYGLTWTPPVFFDQFSAVSGQVDTLTFNTASGQGAPGVTTLVLSPDPAERALYVVGTTSDDLARFTQSGTGVAVQVYGGAASPAIRANAGAGQIAVSATSGTNATSAVSGIGDGTAIGVDGLGGASGTGATGVRGTGGQSKATGVHGRTAANGDTDAYGVRGEGRGAGAVGVMAESTAGRALVVQGDASTPAYPAMRIIPQDADPTTGVSDGDTIWHADHKTLRTCVAGYGYRSVPTFGPGSAFQVCAAQPHNDEDNTLAGFAGAFLTVLCDTTKGTGFYGSSAGAEVRIDFSGDVRLNTAADDYFELNLIDVTNGATIATWTGGGNAPNNGFFLLGILGTVWQRSIGFGLRYAPPADGDLEIALQIAHANNTCYIRNACLTVTGTF